MLDSISDMMLKELWNHVFGMETLSFCHYVRNLDMYIIT